MNQQSINSDPAHRAKANQCLRDSGHDVRIVLAKVAEDYDVRALDLQLVLPVREADIAIVVRYRTTTWDRLYHLVAHSVREVRLRRFVIAIR
ncbi:hypothetical protein DBV15_11659 [Temnothorax longispinosus]|uniref:Uncharacterized protein n=1 Tax=Temnothorax longispinosus TaxID=300112 RepID=A0A4S2KS21_9HYME|nr:hypothetical protein DBV15_11659 [Temnothorax longispinosus]